MTPVPPAEPRPPPLRPPDLPRNRTNSVSDFEVLTGRTLTETNFPTPSQEQNADDRPLKRRRLDHSPDSDAGTKQQRNALEKPSNAEPKRRLIEDFRVLSAVIASQGKEDTKTQQTEPPPLPTRPWNNPRPTATSDEVKQTHRSRLSLDVPTSPDTSHDPAPVPALGESPAGYFPWVGKHPEDSLSEANVKQGYFDRPPNPPDRELSTARVPLYNAFRHRSGIGSLSTLFSLVLDAKNKHGLISSASTFKPPPRVTLSEAKRKSWITELADSNVPLRRLSRTIPQGVRGQILLEQCVLNAVPLSRAIWFTKCVGANEIRTLKRKGTTPAVAVGAEGKWLREWTINVEQFIEITLSQCGQPAWKAGVEYTIRLITRLYLENLVDRDHFLDWIVKSFSTSDNERLPFWLMFIHIYKQDLAKHRKRAKSLVEGLIQKYKLLRSSTDEVVQSLAAKLRSAVRGFALNRPECLISPDSWHMLRPGLELCLSQDSPPEMQLLDRLEQVNRRCMGFSRQQYLSQPDPSDAVLAILDSGKTPHNATLLSDKLLSACPDTGVLATSCLDWATTKFRCGSGRVYLIARLLRKWEQQDRDIESPLLQFVTSCHNPTSSRDFDALHHLVAELSRSDTFPTSKYMQWLNVRGLPRAATVVRTNTEGNLMIDCGFAVRQNFRDDGQVLIDMSLSDAKPRLVNQRNALLARTGFDSQIERDAVSLVRTILDPLLFGSTEEQALRASLSELVHICSGWNWSVRSELSHWMRACVATRVRQQVSSDGKNPLRDSTFSTQQFGGIRLILETLEDEAVLADMIGLCSSFENEELHACLVETITRHAEAFSAIGALQPLQIRMYQIYISLRNVKLTMPLLATALLDLCTTYPHKSTPTRILQQDFIREDRGRAVAASSPFSDSIAVSLQQAETTFVDDFEAVLQSEPSLNEQTMNRLFALLTERISKHSRGGDDGILFTYCQLMSRLRQYRKQQGDHLVKRWLTKVLSKTSTNFAQTLAFSMIGTGALTIDVLIEAVSAGDLPKSTLSSFLPQDATMQLPCQYAVSTKWLDFASRKPADLINLLSEVPASARSLLDERRCYTEMILTHSKELEHLSQPGLQAVDEYLFQLLVTDNDTDDDLKAALALTTAYSLPFVQLRLQLESTRSANVNDNLVPQLIVDLLFDDSGEAVADRHLPALLQGAGVSVGSATRHLTEVHLLDLLPTLPSGKNSDGDLSGLEAMERATQKAFHICQASTTQSTKCFPQLIDKLSQLLKYLGHVNPPLSPAKATATSPTSASTPQFPNIASQLFNPSSPMEATAPRPYSPSIIQYFRILLQLLCLFRPRTSTTIKPASPSSSSNGKQTITAQPPKSQSDQIKVLILLASLITQRLFISPLTVLPDHPTASADAAETVSFAYDVMATYADDLTDEGRTLCAKILRDKLNPVGEAVEKIPASAAARLQWLFGSINASGSDLREAEEMGKGLTVSRKGESRGEWKPRVWEVLGSQGVKDSETTLGLGLFGARR